MFFVLCFIGHIIAATNASPPVAFINFSSTVGAKNNNNSAGTAYNRNGNSQTLLFATAKPRSGLGQQLLDIALHSPIWEYVLVPQARASIVKTAEENNIPWIAAKEWLMNQEDAPWGNGKDADVDHDKLIYPEYYKKPFHAYADGNLSYEAAFEQELAVCCSICAMSMHVICMFACYLISTGYDTILQQ